jgi:hypothetical protein
MADVVDNAEDFSEFALKKHAENKAPSVQRGRCLYCNAVVEHLYCDDFCRKDYEYEQSILKRK